MFRLRLWLAAGAAASGLALAFLHAAEPIALPPAAAQTVDFSRDIQPILASRCYECHGPEKQKGSLRLDVKSAALKGGDLGAAILPGQSANSPLIRFVSGLDEDMAMPPKGERLSAAQIGLLRAWIDQGAKWPDDPEAERRLDKTRHWAFQPAARPSVPSDVASHPIDAFVRRSLREQGLKPSPEADRRTLIRRAYYDLWGLPPAPEDVERFVADPDPMAYDKLIDRLLDSPRYGERWGRRWLDAVHFGESHGYDKDKPRPNAWPYRDYVIRSFNEDKPYSRFVQEQIAGDVRFPDTADGVVATGFIASGPWDFVGHVELPESKTDGLIARYNDRDDMVMTALSTFQSLTVHCARCHDHKFDPITTREYYQLQAVFAGVDRADRWFDSDPATFARRRSLLERKKILEQQQREFSQLIAAVASPEVKAADEELAAARRELKQMPKAGESSSNGYHSAIEREEGMVKWAQVDLGRSAAIEEVRLIPARPTDFADTPGFGFPKRYRIEISDEADFAEAVVLADRSASDAPNPGDAPMIAPGAGATGRYVRVTATKLWERTADFVFALAELQVMAGGTNIAVGATVSALDSIEAGRWSKAGLVDNQDSLKTLAPDAEPASRIARRKQLEQEIQETEAWRRQLALAALKADARSAAEQAEAELKETNIALDALPAPQRVYATANDFKGEGQFSPARTPRAVHVLLRGDVKQPKELAPPGALACVPGVDPEFGLSAAASDGERRAALARWLTHPQNHLARRSIVNRVWEQHFGRGIVETANDFGHMGARPTHPELLDWLAYWFQDNGESLKKLHKLILTSAAWRQGSDSNAEGERLDSDNRWLWRMNRSRLDSDSLRDAVLQVSGKLDLTMGGPSVRQFFFKDDHSPVYDYARYDSDSSFRRSVYRFIVRSVPDPFMDCLDSADPSLLTPRRNTTLTALQALATLNDAFMLKQAGHLAQRLAQASGQTEGQIAELYRLALNRAPRAEELKTLSAHAAKYGLPNACRVILNSNEFMFVD